MGVTYKGYVIKTQPKSKLFKGIKINPKEVFKGESNDISIDNKVYEF